MSWLRRQSIKSTVNHYALYNYTETSEYNSPTTPNVNSWPIAFFTKQQFWRSVPQRYHFVSVRPLLVIRLVQACKAEVCQLQFTTAIRNTHYCSPFTSRYNGSLYLPASVHHCNQKHSLLQSVHLTLQQQFISLPERWRSTSCTYAQTGPCQISVQQLNVNHIVNSCRCQLTKSEGGCNHSLHRVSEKTPTHIIGYKLRSSCLILIIFGIKIPHIIWYRMTA